MSKLVQSTIVHVQYRQLLVANRKIKTIVRIRSTFVGVLEERNGSVLQALTKDPFVKSEEIWARHNTSATVQETETETEPETATGQRHTQRESAENAGD